MRITPFSKPTVQVYSLESADSTEVRLLDVYSVIHFNVNAQNQDGLFHTFHLFQFHHSYQFAIDLLTRTLL